MGVFQKMVKVLLLLCTVLSLSVGNDRFPKSFLVKFHGGDNLGTRVNVTVWSSNSQQKQYIHENVLIRGQRNVNVSSTIDGNAHTCAVSFGVARQCTEVCKNGTD